MKWGSMHSFDLKKGALLLINITFKTKKPKRDFKINGKFQVAGLVRVLLDID